MTKYELLQKISFPITTKTVFIFRGIPGSGKSTLTNEIASKTKDDSLVCSADRFWCLEDGSYRFDRTKVPQNHQYCLRKFTRGICEGSDGHGAERLYVDE
jgi:ABC-type multidrug transport system ATPase subunit